jgi:uncharacterized membrane protein
MKPIPTHPSLFSDAFPAHPVLFLFQGMLACGVAAFALAALIAWAAASRPEGRRWQPRPAAIVGAAAGAYFVFFAAWTLARHAAMATHGFDTGYFANVVWQFGRGHFLAQTLLPTQHGFSDAVVPLLALLAPFTYVFRDPAYLFILQALCGAAGVVLVYLLARPVDENASRWPAAALALSLALSPMLHGANLLEFHPRAFALPMGLAAFLCFGRRRFAAGVAFTAALALCQEDLALNAVALALWGGFACRRRLAGVVAAGAFALYAVGFCIALYPRLTYATGGAAPHWTGFFTSAAPAHMRLFLPMAKTGYLGVLLLPLAAFLPTAGGALITVLTPLLTPLASTKLRVFAFWWHYPWSILPFLYGGAAIGLRRLSAASPGRGRTFLLTFGAAAAVAFQVFLIAYCARTYYGPEFAAAKAGPHERALAAAAAAVPADVPIVCDDGFAARLAHRRYCFMYGFAREAPLPAPPAALLLERRGHALNETAAILDAAALWGLRLRECNADIAYFTAAGTAALGPDDFVRTWWGALEEIDCVRAGKMLTAAVPLKEDPRAHDGRAAYVERHLAYIPRPGDVYPAGAYDLGFRLRSADAASFSHVVVAVTVAAADGSAEESFRLDQDLMAVDAYETWPLAFRSPRPFRLSFDLYGLTPFYFDAVTIASPSLNAAALR